MGTDPPPHCYDKSLQTLGVPSVNVFVQASQGLPSVSEAGCQAEPEVVAAVERRVEREARPKLVERELQTESPAVFCHNTSGASPRAYRVSRASHAAALHASPPVPLHAS